MSDHGLLPSQIDTGEAFCAVHMPCKSQIGTICLPEPGRYRLSACPPAQCALNRRWTCRRGSSRRSDVLVNSPSRHGTVQMLHRVRCRPACRETAGTAGRSVMASMNPDLSFAPPRSHSLAPSLASSGGKPRSIKCKVIPRDANKLLQAARRAGNVTAEHAVRLQRAASAWAKPCDNVLEPPGQQERGINSSAELRRGATPGNASGCRPFGEGRRKIANSIKAK